MSDTENTTPAETTEATDQVSGAEATSGAADQGTDNGGNELDADTLRKELKAARDEAAKYRVNARELRTQLENAKSPEDYAAVAGKVEKLETELHTARLAAQYNLPAALASRIQGDTEEARDADAKALSALVSQPETLGSGGLTPGSKPEKADPRTLAARVPRSRR